MADRPLPPISYFFLRVFLTLQNCIVVLKYAFQRLKKNRPCLPGKICSLSLKFYMRDIFDTGSKSWWQQTHKRLSSCVNNKESLCWCLFLLIFILLGNTRNVIYRNRLWRSISAWRDAFTDSRELSFSRQVCDCYRWLMVSLYMLGYYFGNLMHTDIFVNHTRRFLIY